MDEYESIQCMLAIESSSRTSDIAWDVLDRGQRIDSRCTAATLYGPDAEGCTVLEEEL
jgi:hypothetical protein